jgi:ferric-dicitrate binding protein FerR (iron transport regulator)
MNSSEKTTKQPTNDVLEALLRRASPRVRPPATAEQAARAALHAQWREMTGQRRRRRVYWPLAAAASLALALGVAAVLLRSPEPALQPVTVATAEVVVGTVLLEKPDGAAAGAVAESLQLRTGTGIATRAGSGLAMRWRDGSSVRLDQDTRVRLTAAGDIHLESGRLYVDAEESTHAAPPVVLTPAGRVRHLGTQYMTAVSPAGTTVSVRRGRVRLDGPAANAEADAGEQLQVDASGSTRRQAIPTWGDLWQWTQATVPAFPADGRTVADFLDWVSRESGRSITYASPQAERLAQQTELRGRIDLEPMTALAAILQTSDLGYEVRDGSLLIRPLAER